MTESSKTTTLISRIERSSLAINARIAPKTNSADSSAVWPNPPLPTAGMDTDFKPIESTSSSAFSTQVWRFFLVTGPTTICTMCFADKRPADVITTDPAGCWGAFDFNSLSTVLPHACMMALLRFPDFMFRSLVTILHMASERSLVMSPFKTFNIISSRQTSLE